MKKICVFCGASLGASSVYAAEAQKLGRMLAAQGIALVFGGGRVGLMGAIADACLEAGGQVIGVIPKALCTRELEHKGLTQQHVVNSMHERKALMAELSDGFIALPGGIGTLDEFFEIWTWAQLGTHQKPCAILNVANYFDLLLQFLDSKVVPEQFVEAKSRNMLLIDQDAATLLERMRNYKAPDIRRYITTTEL